MERGWRHPVRADSSRPSVAGVGFGTGEPDTRDEIGITGVEGLTCFRSSFPMAVDFCFTSEGTRTTREFILALWALRRPRA